MSKPVKELIVESYKQQFAGVSGAVLVDIRGINANDNNRLRSSLAEKDVKVTVVKNTLARKAFENTDLEAISQMLEGANALVYPVSQETTVVNVARELMSWAKEVPNLEFRGALMEGVHFAADEVEALSNYPTREEAQAEVVQLLLAPAQKLVGSVLGPGQQVAGLLKSIEEKLEKGESITKVA